MARLRSVAARIAGFGGQPARLEIPGWKRARLSAVVWRGLSCVSLVANSGDRDIYV
jgi:hypothetical protein